MCEIIWKIIERVEYFFAISFAHIMHLISGEENFHYNLQFENNIIHFNYSEKVYLTIEKKKPH